MGNYFGRNHTPKDVEAIATGLEAIQDDFRNPERSRHANFLALTLREKAGKMTKEQSIATKSNTEGFYDTGPNRPTYELFTTTRRQEIIKDAEAEAFRPDQDPKEDPDLKLEVSRLVRQKNCPTDELIALGYKLARRYVSPTQSTAEAVKTFASLAYAIDRAKVKAVGLKTPTVLSNQIIWAATSEVAHMIPHNDVSLAEIRHIREKLEVNTAVADWLYPKFDMLSSHVYKYRQVDDYIARYTEGVAGKLRGVTIKTRALGDSVSDDSYATDLMSELLRLKRYTVKPAYFAGDIFTKNVDESWIFNASESLFGMAWDQAGGTIANPFVAKIDLASKADPEDLSGDLRTINYSKTAHINVLEYSDFHPHLLLGVYPDGEIGLMSGGNVRDIRQEFVAASKEDLYETLQLTFIKNLFDLVVPAEVVEQLPGNEKSLENFKLFSKFRQAVDQSPIRDLVLARIKYIREHGSEIEEIMDRDDYDERTGHLREHGVVGHVRRLPEGYSPTSESIALAERFGIKLGPNETFVREHRRGNVENGTISSHKAVQTHSHIHS